MVVKWLQKIGEKSLLMVVDILVTLKLTLILRPMLYSVQVLEKLSYSILRGLQRTISPAGTNIETLAHAEGARWVVAVMKARCEKGRKQND